MHGSADEVIVLHVDDEPGLGDVAATFLERQDDRLTVRTATSAADGLELLAEQEVDCIVSDYDMPGRNGIEFLDAVRESHPDIPFVLFTGKGSEEIASRAISAGVSDYLQKESGTDQYAVLANRITNLVEQRRAEADLETRVHQQRIVATLGREALAGAGLETLFDTAVEAVADALGNEYAKVLEHRPERDELLLRAGVGWRDGLVGEATVSDGVDSQAGYTLRSEEPVVVDRLSTESRFSGPPLLTDHDVCSGISVVVGDTDEPWGVLGTHTTEPRRFTDHDVTFVQSVANVLASAIEWTERERDFARIERAIDEAPIGVTLTDPALGDNPITYANTEFERLTGYSEAEIRGRNCRVLQGEETDPESVTAMREAIAANERVSVELRNYRKDGSPFWNRVTIAPVVDENDEVVNFVGFQENVSRRKERERERDATIEFLQQLYDVATDTELDAKAKITRLLEAGPEKLGLPYGHLTRIEVGEEGEGTQRIVEASGDHDLLQPGDSCPLSRSYCRQTIKNDGLLEIQNVVEAGWGRDPAYETFKLGCYIGTRITVDDELYGTVFFASTTPREEPFTDAERTFVRLMSKLVSYELEAERAKSERGLRRDRREELERIVSNDLQDPIETARARLELARGECDSEHLDAVERAHERTESAVATLLAFAHEDDMTDGGAADIDELTES